MSEKRKACLSILIKEPGDKETTRKIELFPASEWGERSSEQTFRVRIDGKWADPKRGKEFRSCAGISEQLQMLIFDGILPEKEGKITPDMVPKGARVRLFQNERFCKDDHESPVYGYTRTIPFVDRDGEWAVYMTGGRIVRLYEIAEILSDGK